MAQRSVIAARILDATAKIKSSAAVIREGLGIEADLSLGVSKDEYVSQAQDLEGIAKFLTAVADAVGPVPTPSTPTPTSPPVARLPDGEGGGENTPEGEPEFGGHPLSFFDGLSDEEILGLPKIGEATLKKIREAQEAAKGNK